MHPYLLQQIARQRQEDLRRAARHGDGWFSPTNYTMDELLATRDELERIRVEAGTMARPFTYYVRVEGAHDMANVERYRREGRRGVRMGGRESR